MLRGEMVKYGEYLALILSLCLVSTFSFPYNFFRVDIFMILVSLLGVLCLVKERAQWLVVPLSALGVMFHQGYVFMYFQPDSGAAVLPSIVLVEGGPQKGPPLRPALCVVLSGGFRPLSLV